jgi:hypothetical protein
MCALTHRPLPAPRAAPGLYRAGSKVGCPFRQEAVAPPTTGPLFWAPYTSPRHTPCDLVTWVHHLGCCAVLLSPIS